MDANKQTMSLRDEFEEADKERPEFHPSDHHLSEVYPGMYKWQSTEDRFWLFKKATERALRIVRNGFYKAGSCKQNVDHMLLDDYIIKRLKGDDSNG